ncbi:hypothetical protein ANANG_G00210750 [Anguilla anguilla]|uniref:Mucin-2 n=1 Tax=Anguilla anguilla TaxID=7936 RepID=A0A9D3RRY5_ANGAN|nr:hypothetical protein ANANG_G00210750 [Anguilla anguilla]
MATAALWTWALVLLFTWASPVEPMKAHPRKHINSICSVWGKDHFKTFDGDIYQFPGMCEYNLVSDCHEAYLDFSVHMKRAEVNGHPTVSRIVVTIKDRIIVLTRNLVTMNGEKITTPYYGAGVLLETNTIYTKLYSKLGLSVMWNGEDAVTLELDSKYQNRTCGLCGDFNGIPLNFEFLEEGREISPIEFGNRQKVHLPTELCEDPPEEDEFEDSGLDKCSKFRDGCTKLLQSEDWKSCARALSPGPYIQACVQDMCSCGDVPDDFCICSTLAEYSRQCSHAGGTPPNWRTQDFCVKQCPLNMVYAESGSACMNTCTNRDTSQLCEEHHVDGCVCPEGTVFDDISERGCIRQEQCQCVHDKAYNSGEVLLQDCEECVCNQGRWSCKSLPCPGQCAIEGGSHVTTYDGKAYTFHGDCYYILTKDNVGSKFTVLGQLVPCGSQDLDTCLKSVVLLLNNDKNNALVIKADGKVSHNAEISLPYSTANVHVFRPSSFHIILQTDFGLQLHIQLIPIMQLYITLDQTYLTKTCGLCGNFNMVLHDDLKTPQGLVEGTAASFANSWKAQASCPNRMERLDDPCSLSIENENYAEYWCSMLQSQKSEFSKCHTMVDPEAYYRRCKYSSCNCEKSEDCLCAVFSSYVRACQAKGVELQGWRTNICGKYTETCPASQTFSYQLQQCQRTCRSLGSERPSCSTDFLPVDGCSCPEGLYQDDRGVCVPVAKCPCYHNGDHIKPGKSITIKEEHCVCSNGRLHCRSWKARSERCPSPKVFFSCSSADANAQGIECARTCSNLGGDCFSSECESGCQCPSGLLDDGRGNCVKEHECPCLHDGHFYAPGRQIPDRCNTCTCTRGMWNCTDHVCPGSCTIYGSGHHLTFDERRFGFRGQCGYVAVQDKCGNKTGMANFRVITENIPCGSTGTTCSKSVRIFLGSTELKLSEGKVEQVSSNGLMFIEYKVRTVGLYIVVESKIGFSVVWDRKTTVRIILEPDHMGKVCGLCGDFDGDAKDDFTTQGQLVVSSPLEFANSWKVSSSCPDAAEDTDACSLNPHRHGWAMLQCSIIKATTFKDCHDKVDPIPYYENCVSDSCACDSGGDCECFCTAVAAYAQACNEAGVCVAWRTPDLCPVYCDYFNAPHECQWHYSPCHPACYKTCFNPDAICSNLLPNMEGCYPSCPPDKPIFDEAKQICVEKCDGCYINDTEYRPGEEVPTEKPCTSCICVGNETVTCEPKPGCCVYNGTEYDDGDIIYDVTDNMGMCYYAICKNETVIHGNETCPVVVVTTPCFCIVNGTYYHPGATIVNMTHIGSGICLTMICSDICKIENSTDICPVTPTPPKPPAPTTTPVTTTTEPPTPTTTPQSTKHPGCPEWGVLKNETFLLCNCTMAVCIEDNIIAIVPYECPPLKEITCTNGKKPVLQMDKYQCCEQYVCDCDCEGWGDPHYITFDGEFYSFQGNCTYVLMEEIMVWYKLKIYIDNVHCDPAEVVSCPRSLIVVYEAHTFVLKNHNLLGAADLEAIINGVPGQKLPYLRNNIKIINTGIDLVLEIPHLGVVITFGVTGFSIHLPFKLFGNNTQGQCGTCNNNKADDCMLPGGQLVDCALMGDYWLVEDLYRPDCSVPPSLPTSAPGPSPTDKPCGPNPICDLLKSSLFAECHAVVSPEPFFRGCVFDSCHMVNPTVECTSLHTYAATCMGSGICVDWRNQTEKCPSNCSPDKVYKPCGPAEQPTCEDTDEDPSMRFMTEGCFCPDGMKLFNKESGVCVAKCGCLDPNGEPREFNEVFQYKCQDCICDEPTKTVICKPMSCPGPGAISCTKPGFVIINETNPENPCCSQLVCRCDSRTCPALDPKCKEGYIPVISVPEGECCPTYECEPKKVCVHNHMEYLPGASIPVEECQDCTCTTEVDPNSGLYRISCSLVPCNQDCEPGFRYIETPQDKCCGKCVQTHCVVEIDGKIQLLEHGHTWSPPGNKCVVHSCIRINGTFVSTLSNIKCPPFHPSNCQPGTIQVSADGCCNVCVEKERACKVETTRTHIFHANCQSVDEIDMTYCEGACNTFSKYNAASAFMQHSCTCCQESRTSNRTVNLLCLNGELLPYPYVHVEECRCKVTDCYALNEAARPVRPKRAGRSLP